MERILKPEQTLKEIFKHLKANSSIKLVDDLSLALYAFKSRTNLIETYSSSTGDNYDYLDEFSLLKPLLSELIKEASSTRTSNDDISKFKFLIQLFNKSSKRSSTPLPPLNWHFFVNSLIKSSKASANEIRPLLEIVLIQMSVNKNRSAFSLIKNYLIDTNFVLFNFDHSTHLLVMESFNLIVSQLSIKLLKKFLNKLRDFLYLSVENANEFWCRYLECILKNLLDYFSASKKSKDELRDDENLHDTELLEFFCFIMCEFEFNYEISNEVYFSKRIEYILRKTFEFYLALIKC